MRTWCVPLAVLVCSVGACAQTRDVRPLDLTIDGEWIGAGVSYGEYRDGQGPAGDAPTVEQIREDLHILKDHWNLIRMYGTRSAETVCRVIREDNLPIRMMLGAWVETESEPRLAASNRAEVENAIRIANAYPDVVVAINVGNETQVFWSGHKVETDKLIAFIEEVRVATSVPVTTCDDYNFWNKPESARVAAVCDFLGLHAYAMWNGQSLADALPWTREQIMDIQSRHPDHTIVLCETGWATDVADSGQQAELIKGEPGERQQELFYRAFRHWATETGLAHFYFSAFDENWKGGDDPSEVEKHWGVFNADRTPKPAVGGTDN